MLRTSSILLLRWKDTYQTAKGGLQANVIAMISRQRAIFKITKWSLKWGNKRRAHVVKPLPASDTMRFCINSLKYLELLKWKSRKKKDSLDTVVAGLRPASRSEHVLHFSSLFLIDFLLGTSRGASLFTVASPQQNRAANWKLISWSAGQTHQNMFDQPRFDYVPPFNFNWLNTQSTRKREGMDSMGFKMVWWHNGHLTHLSETGQLQNLRLSTTCNELRDQIKMYIIYHFTDLMKTWWSLLWSSCRLPACSGWELCSLDWHWQIDQLGTGVAEKALARASHRT